MKMRIKRGDRVKVRSGKYKGVEGKVLRRDPGKNTVVVEGVNMATRHARPTQQNPQGGIMHQEAPLYADKVMLVCPSCGDPTRVARGFLDSGQKVRVCKKCGEIIDQV
ncbi:MAG: 50S ribosomal protein L24 [Synergistales bacterium]|nr:50S ribosomal protein L24 [Synergistales bacterium]